MNVSAATFWHLSLIICHVLCSMSRCTRDCTENILKNQISCQVVESEPKCDELTNNVPKNGVINAELPLDLQIYVNSLGKVNIKWKSPDILGDHKATITTQVYMLKIWRYKDILTDGYSFKFDKCYISNRTESSSKENGVFGNFLSRSAFIHLVPLPQLEADKNYIHRSITIYNHTPKDRTEWKPSFISVYNDSCSNSIEVKFDFAPKKYGFPGYMVAVRKAPDIGFHSDVKNKIFKEKEKMVVFENIAVGHYLILIVPLRCQDCWATYSAAFVIHEKDMKCSYEVSTSTPIQEVPYTEELQEEYLQYYILVAAFVCLIIIIVLLLVMFLHKYSTQCLAHNPHAHEEDAITILRLKQGKHNDSDAKKRLSHPCVVKSTLYDKCESTGQQSEINSEFFINENDEQSQKFNNHLLIN